MVSLSKEEATKKLAALEEALVAANTLGDDKFFEAVGALDEFRESKEYVEHFGAY